MDAALVLFGMTTMGIDSATQDMSSIRCPEVSKRCTQALIEEAAGRYNLITQEQKDHLISLCSTNYPQCLREIDQLKLHSQTEEAKNLRYVAIKAMYEKAVLADGTEFSRNTFNTFNQLDLSQRKEFVQQNHLLEACKIRCVLTRAESYELIDKDELASLRKMKPDELIQKWEDAKFRELEKSLDERDRQQNSPIQEAKLSQEEAQEGFKLVFNGRDLDGWRGATEGYEVNNGAISCKPCKGGILYTDTQYKDFVARFEFKLSPGGNNGVAIRYPGEGEAAFMAAVKCRFWIMSSMKKT